MFDALDGLSVGLLQTARLIDATLHLKLVGRRTMVKINICPGRGTIAGGSGVPAVEAWMRARGFANDEDGTGVLESA